MLLDELWREVWCAKVDGLDEGRRPRGAIESTDES